MPRAVAIVLAAAVLAGCGSSGYAPTNLQTAPPPATTAPTAGPGTHTVIMEGLAFRPGSVTTTVGRGVEWVNRDAVRHNVTTVDGTTISSPDLRPGGRFVYVPARPGRLRYYCTIHPSTMSGELTVLAR
ncbi:MAG: plastocyanin/azurin family copper-binding protein [Solirubrobacteraceae bacterium]